MIGNVKITPTTDIGFYCSQFFGIQDGRYFVDQHIQKVCDDDNFNAVKSKM